MLTCYTIATAAAVENTTEEWHSINKVITDGFSKEIWRKEMEKKKVTK